MENDSLYTPKKAITKAAKYFDVFERCLDVTISMRLIDKEHDMDLSDKGIIRIKQEIKDIHYLKSIFIDSIS